MAHKRKLLRSDDVHQIRQNPTKWGMIHWDDAVRGLGLRCSARGHCAWIVMRRVRGEPLPTRITIGNVERMGLERARYEARHVIEDMDAGLNPMEKRRTARRRRALRKQESEQRAAGKFEDRVKAYFQSVGGGLRSIKRIRATFDRTVMPEWRNHQLHEIRRHNVAHLLDRVACERGPAAATYLLAIVRAFFNWCAVRDETFVSPIVRGMLKVHASARDRVLTDDEIRAFWAACSDAKPRVFGAIARLLLLTGQRRNEIACARWDEVTDDGTLVVPSSRVKTKVEQKVPLSAPALTIIAGVAKHSDYIFSTRDNLPMQGFGKAKRLLDESMLAYLRENADAQGKDSSKMEMKSWTLHDLRRTARSLMSRAGVRPDHAERVLGHVIRGVEGVYDRHRYEEEKADALSALAQLIERILSREVAKRSAEAPTGKLNGFDIANPGTEGL